VKLSRSSYSPVEAFTLVEALVAVGVLAILFVIIFKAVPGYRDRAEGVKCAQNMKSLATSLGTYIQDVGHWPQEPEEIFLSNNNNTYEDWWLKTLAPYGGTEMVWQCPTIRRKVVLKSKEGRPKIHYTPTKFDATPYTPFKWSTQPWLVEIGNMHGAGALLCFPDGSVRSMNDVAGY
jgi:type II secretory pathway pseudopilin PulG